MAYHVNDQTGRAGICRANNGNCPFGGSEEHFGTKAEAKEHHEEQMYEKFVAAAHSNYLKASSTRKKIEKSEKEKAAEMAAEIEANRIENYKASMRDNKNIALHNDPGLAFGIVQRFIKRPGIQYKDRVPQPHYSVNAGHLNPARCTGDGKQFFDEGDGSMVILADREGKRARVLNGSGDQYGDDPWKNMGQPATHIKQGNNGDAKTEGLFVVGYVNSEGKRFGYVPDKNIWFFRYK